MPRRRPRIRSALALLASTALAATSLALGTAPAQSATAPAAKASAEDFQQVTLAKGAEEVGEPMSLAVLPDRKVLHTSRDGILRLTDENGTTKQAGRLAVYHHDEEGLQGVGVDPDFARNRAVYLYYAPPLDTPAGDAPNDGTAADFTPFDGVNRLSRFTLHTDGTLDNASEKKILDVPASRGICCHVGGDIDFDKDGNLYLSTGDDSNPFASDGFTPIDERDTRNPAYDAQRSAGNTNSLRGKILRIKVADDGSYTVPSGNLFAPGTDRARPEIYAMGFRNPFRMSVDKPTGIVYVGDYGPDAGAADPKRRRPARSSSPASPSRATSAGRTAPATTTPMWTTTSRRRRPARPSTAARPRTTRRTTQASSTCRPRRPRGSRTTAAPCPSSAPAPSPRWAAPSTAMTPRPRLR